MLEKLKLFKVLNLMNLNSLTCNIIKDQGMARHGKVAWRRELLLVSQQLQMMQKM